MASSEFPLKTNYELTRILNMYNGSNEIEILKHIGPKRISIVWKTLDFPVDGSFLYVVETNTSKASPPHGYKIAKGSAYAVFSRKFVEYAITSQNAKDLLKWSVDTYSPDELYWATLQLNTQFNPPGGFKGM